MIRSVFDNNNSRDELFEVIKKGIDLLGRDYINQNLFDAWNKYMLSTLKLVDAAYYTNYAMEFEDKDDFWFLGVRNQRFGLANSLLDNHRFNIPASSLPNSAMAAKSGFNFSTTNEYKDKLQTTLKRLLSIAKRIS
ncbi:MAG: hypothetical protein FWE50_03505 [Alphaproteobacteria bacterium]|nr:hypothetical protein [Alphaproteobacteria bacterium]